MNSRAPAARTDGSALSTLLSAYESRGLCRHLQVSSVPSQASNVIGYRLTKNVVGPADSKSLATLALIP